MTLSEHRLLPVCNKSDDDDETETPLPVFKRYETQGVVRQISFYLSGEIGAPIQYTDLLYTLRTASEVDIIYLHLKPIGKSPGFAGEAVEV